jgi:phosphotransferase system HPr-like phosphotransfer protein
MTTFTCTLNCKEEDTPVLHMRPASFLVKLCNWFPLKEFKLRRVGEPPEDSANPKSILELGMKAFEDGDELVVEVTKQCQVLAAVFVRIALENLSGYSNDTAGVMRRLTALIDEAFLRTQDPDLDASGAFHLLNASRQKGGDDEVCRAVVAINDHLHDLTVSVLPEIAKHFNSSIELLFEVSPDGIYSFLICERNGFVLVFSLSKSGENGCDFSLGKAG